jgi:hypothetical protein
MPRLRPPLSEEQRKDRIMDAAALAQEVEEALKAFKERDLSNQEKSPVEPVKPVAATEALPAPAVERPPEPQPELSKPPDDDATAAMRRAVESDRRSQQVWQERQRQLVQAAMLQQVQQRRDEWLSKNPKARQYRHRLGEYHAAALAAGLPDTSDSYFQFMADKVAALPPYDAEAEMRKEVEALQSLQKSQQTPPGYLLQESLDTSSDEAPMPQPTPPFFKPPPAPKPAASRPIVSAPVSRVVPNGSGVRPRGRVELSPAEVDAARVSGISVEEYAKQKMRYQGMRETGEYRDNRER